MTIFLDSNVILDILLKNDKFYNESRTLLELSAEKSIDFFISATSITDIYYIVKKYKKDDVLVRDYISELLKVVSIAGVDEICIKNALQSSWKDFEDAVQNEAATQIGADYLVTRNIKDFKVTFTEIITPTEFLQKIKS